MTDRKSSRPRKAICYSTLGNESESDDDFASSHPSKKQKTTNKKEDKTMSEKEDKVKRERKKDDSTKSSSVTKSLTSTPSSILKRRSNFDDELQRAMELSMLETSASQSSLVQPDTGSQLCKTDNAGQGSHNRDLILTNVKVDIEPIPSAAPLLEKVPDLNVTDTAVLNTRNPSDKDLSSPEPPKLFPVTATSSVCTAILDNTIEYVKSPEISDTGRRKRTVSKKETSTTKQKTSSIQKRIIEDDDDKNSEAGSDFVPDDRDSSDEDEDEEDDFSPSDDDNDFDDGRKKGAKKKPVAKKDKKVSSVQTKSQKPNTNARARKCQKTSIKDVATTPLEPKSLSKNSITMKTPNRGGASNSRQSSSSTSLSSPSLATTAVSSPVLPKSSSTNTLKSTPSTPSTSCGPVSRQWKPPGQSSSSSSSPSAGSGSLLKSPSSGGLRLGLSRNQRVKSLHSSVKVV